MSRPRKHVMPDEAEGTPILNEFAEDTYEDEPPSDVENFLSEIGLSGKTYRCTIKQFPPSESGTPVFLPGQWENSYPSIATLGSKFGPGKYRYVFSWRAPTPTGGTKSTMKEHDVTLGEQWQDAHEEYMYQYSLARQKKLEALTRKAEVDAILAPDRKKNQDKGTGIESLLDAKNTLQNLGVPVGQAGAVTTGDTASVLPLIISMQQKSTELLVTMMNNSQAHMMTLITGMMQNQNNSPFQSAMKEAISMVTSVVDLKSALNPEKQTLIDKVFEFMQTVSPQIMTVLAQPRAKARQDPLVQLAKKQPDFAAIAEDQSATDALAAKFDSEYGIRQTNDILDIMGLKRSEAMKKNMQATGYNGNEPEMKTPPESPPPDAEITPSDETADSAGESTPEPEVSQEALNAARANASLADEIPE